MTEELPDPGQVPVLDWIDKALITVDPLYQRPLDTVRAADIARVFSWRSFGALVVVPAGNGYHVTDGQHRLEAAKFHPKVTHVPAVIVQAETIQTEAGMFVDINKHRKNVSGLELFFAELAAETGNAAETLKAATAAGLRIPKYPGNYKANDTIAVGALQALVSNYTDSKVHTILSTVAAGSFRPVAAMQIKAVECLLTDREFAPQIDSEDLATLLRSVGTTLDSEAKRFAATHCRPLWSALANVWFQKCKKRRAPVSASAPLVGSRTIQTPAPRPLVRPEIAARAAELAARNAPLPRQNVTSSIFGDPQPGRSALDQRKVTT